MNTMPARINLVTASAMLLVFVGFAAGADQPTVHAPLHSVNDRKPAPNFVLKDASGKTVQLKDYRGKVVLLDFWATWCTGCKKEIPWFSEFQGKYGAKGFAVVGVSLDEGGWNVLKPFLSDNKVPYRMLLGDDSTAREFGITNLPDTFLIDRQGRVAATYRERLVDKDDVEANIRAILSEH
jgi:peroxiredoxin